MEEKEVIPSSNSQNHESAHFRKFVMKEMLDKIGFGFGSQQFLNVLFYLSGASIFLVGIVNGLKSVISMLLGIFAQEYNKLRRISKRFIGFSGILFGFSFLFMAMGRFISSSLVFSAALLLSGISVVIYGEFSQNFFTIGKKREALENIAKYGLIMTAISLVSAAVILDNYKDSASLAFSAFGAAHTIRMPGYLIVFEIAAISFILSGYFLSSVDDDTASQQNSFSFSEFFSGMKQKYSDTFRKKFLLMMMAFNIIIGLVQVVGNSYYGIFIYQHYRGSYFGGFLNIAIVFLIAVFSSLIGYLIAKMNIKSYGSIFMLVIGGIFLSAMPFVYYLGSSLGLLTAGTIIGVIGASALGVSSSMLLIELLHEQDRESYYILSGIFSVIPYMIFVPIFSYAAQKFNLGIVFLALSIVTIVFTAILLASYNFSRKTLFL